MSDVTADIQLPDSPPPPPPPPPPPTPEGDPATSSTPPPPPPPPRRGRPPRVNPSATSASPPTPEGDPATSSAPPPPPPPRRGRPPRVNPSATSASPPPPFVGGPPQDAKESPKEAPKGKAARAAQNATSNALVAIDNRVAAAQLHGLAEMLIGMLWESRYGELQNPATGKRWLDELAVTQKEKEAVIDALAAFLGTSLTAMTPGAALAIAFLGTYAGRTVPLETIRFQHKRRQKRAAAGQA